jgi:hypothetical protein
MWIIHPLLYVSIFQRSPWGEMVGATLGVLPSSLVPIAAGFSVVLWIVVVVLELRRPVRSIGKLLYYTVICAHPFWLAVVPSSNAGYYILATCGRIG